MKKAARTVSLVVTLLSACPGGAFASPSSQIWIPSSDVQQFKCFQLGIDNFFRASGNAKSAPSATATRDANVLDIGPLVGVLPFEKLQMEVGFDYIVTANDPSDNHPWSANFKLGTPEGSLSASSPAIAAGAYNLGPPLRKEIAPAVTAGQNIVYAVMAKTLPAIDTIPSLGRLTAGWYRGSQRALVSVPDASGATHKENDGILLSWDRAMKEISDKLWFGVDYQGGHNAVGALNFGASWFFAKNVSVIFAYDIYTRRALAGNNTFNTQLQANFP